MKGCPVPLESEDLEEEVRSVSEDGARDEKRGLYVVGEGENEEGVVVVNAVAVVERSITRLTEMKAIPKPLLFLRRVRLPHVLAGSSERPAQNVQQTHRECPSRLLRRADIWVV